LKDEEGRWKMVREELEEIQNKYGNPKIDPRRSRIEEAEEVEYTAESFIVEEDNVVIVSRDGWVKRQKEVKDLSTTRLREGDSVLAAIAGSTRATMVFFSNFGVAYTSRIVDVPASTGYGDPVQKLFKLKDGEKIVAAFSLDPRVAKKIEAKRKAMCRRCTRLRSPATATRCGSRCSRSSKRARDRAAATRAPPKAPKWSTSASPPARRR
jgi:DNA gyrase subunit A